MPIPQLVVTIPGHKFVLRPGEQEVATFGRGAWGKGVDLVIGRPGERTLQRRCGKIELRGEYWVVKNKLREYPMLVSQAGGGRGNVLIESREAQAFTWPHAEIEIRIDASESYFLGVEAAVRPITVSESSSAAGDTDPRRLYGIKQFYALVVLCEPRLRNEQSAFVPSDKEIVQRLRETGLAADATPKKVERWLDAERSNMGMPPAYGNMHNRYFLVDHAITNGRVATHHRALLGDGPVPDGWD